MYPSSFEYYRAESVREAAKLLKQHPGAKLLAGGHSIIPLLKLRQTSSPCSCAPMPACPTAASPKSWPP